MRGSPYGSKLGMRLVEVAGDRATIALPYDGGNANTGGLLHGGATCSLVDMAAGVAASLGAGVDPPPRGSTVSLSIEYIDAVREEDIEARATVLRRGGSLCFCEVEVIGGDGRLVAKALVTYRIAT